MFTEQIFNCFVLYVSGLPWWLGWKRICPQCRRPRFDPWVVLGVKNPPANAGDIRDVGSIPGLERSSGGGHGSPVFMAGESHGQRRLVGYSPWGRKESDTTEWLITHIVEQVENKDINQDFFLAAPAASGSNLNSHKPQKPLHNSSWKQIHLQHFLTQLFSSANTLVRALGCKLLYSATSQGKSLSTLDTWALEDKFQ